jgi:hypothetical protein
MCPQGQGAPCPCSGEAAVNSDDIPKPAFLGREEARRRQEQKLDRARERLQDALAYERLKKWFVESGALAELRERAAAWIEKQAEDPAELDRRILAWLGDGGGVSRLKALLVDSIEPLLGDRARMGALAGRIAGWVKGKIGEDAFLWAVHERVKRMGGAAGRLADLTGVVDYYELTHQVTGGLSQEMDSLSGPGLDAFSGVLRDLLSEIRSWDVSQPESVSGLASLLAELVRARGPALAAAVRAWDPARLPDWVDRALFAVNRRACGMVLDGIESLLLPGRAGEAGKLAGLESVIREILAEPRQGADA